MNISKKARISKHKCVVCGSRHRTHKYKKEIYLCSKHIHHMERHGKILQYNCFMPNEIIKEKSYGILLLKDRKGNIRNKTLIDLEDIDRIIKHSWCIDSGGYVMTYIKGEYIRLHRFLLMPEKGVIVDHINRNTLDNRKENLRLSDYTHNLINQKRRKDNTSGYTGVYYNKLTNKWFANIHKYKRLIYLGTYSKKSEAIKARKLAEEKYFGNYKYKE